MKALLLWGDHLIKVMEIERITPEIKIAIPQSLTSSSFSMQDPLVPTKHPVITVMVFRYIDGGGRYAVYELSGFRQ